MLSLRILCVLTAVGGWPARPGEIVHLWGTGFGPVSPAVATGLPTKASPLSRTESPMVCVMKRLSAAEEIPATVLFAGLAPLTIGYYQVDLLLPKPLSRSDYFFSCDLPGSGSGGSFSSGFVPVR